MGSIALDIFENHNLHVATSPKLCMSLTFYSEPKIIAKYFVVQ